MRAYDIFRAFSERKKAEEAMRAQRVAGRKKAGNVEVLGNPSGQHAQERILAALEQSFYNDEHPPVDGVSRERFDEIKNRYPASFGDFQVERVMDPIPGWHVGAIIKCKGRGYPVLGISLMLFDVDSDMWFSDQIPEGVRDAKGSYWLMTHKHDEAIAKGAEVR